MTVGHTCLHADFIKAAISLVKKEEVRDRVIGHEQIHPAIVINVCGDNAPGFAQHLRNAGVLAYIRECAIPVVMK